GRRAATVDEYDLPGHEIGSRRGEIDHASDEFLRLHRPIERYARHKELVDRRILQDVLADRRIHHRGRNTIDIDVVRRPFRRKLAGEEMHGALAGAVADIAERM